MLIYTVFSQFYYEKVMITSSFLISFRLKQQVTVQTVDTLEQGISRKKYEVSELQRSEALGLQVSLPARAFSSRENKRSNQKS